VEQILRALFVYTFLLVLFRLLGKRSLGQITTFDLVLLVIVSETTQGALVGEDSSVTTMVLLVVTLVGVDLLLSVVKPVLPNVEKWIEGVPLVILERGVPLEERMRKARVDLADILTAAREKQGLRALEEIEYAVLERNGSISIIPRQS
jgi:uncharacterized membrane protein YcaP (DUF421 family)